MKTEENYTIPEAHREFADHQEIAEELDVDVYFAHPYASWEKGTNENTNGLLRQYFPKGSDFSKITDEKVQLAQKRLNRILR
jgi:IS30 family transposase